jgi:hypothetical protein
LTGCKAKVPEITGPFEDTFERAEVGHGWLNTGASAGVDYKVSGGRLNVSMAHNHPLWLRQKLPRDVVVELDVMSKSPDGDLKVELFGDGESYDPDGNRYQPSGYIFIFGGWRNSLSVIARLDEHDAGVKVQRGDVKVEPGRVYKWTITRKGGHLDWQIDGQPFLSWTDPEPLSGKGHEFFAINNWEADVYFDNLRIRPAP